MKNGVSTANRPASKGPAVNSSGVLFVGCNQGFWLSPLSLASDGRGGVVFLTINTRRGGRAAVWSPSGAGHGRPSLSLGDLLFCSPEGS